MPKKRKNILLPWLVYASIVFFLISSPPVPAQEEPVSRSTEVIKLKEHEVQFNKDWGVSVAFLGKGHLHQLDATLVEIPPVGETEAHKHLAEEVIYIVSGEGYTLMWNGSQKETVRYDWQEGDLLSPTLNASHQHFNASPDSPARYLSVTTVPLMEKLFNNRSFIFQNEFRFDDRWKKAILRKPEYLKPEKGFDLNKDDKAGLIFTAMEVGHYLPNVRRREMRARGRGMAGITMYPDPQGTMAGNQMFEVVLRDVAQGSRTPWHRHVWEVVYLILKGKGYSIRQRVGMPERKVQWSEGDMFIMDSMEYHVHFPDPNSADAPRMLQFKAPGYFGWSDIYGNRIGVNREFLMQPKPAEK